MSPTEESLKFAAALREIDSSDRNAVDKAIDEGLHRLLLAEGTEILDAQAMLVPATEMVVAIVENGGEFHPDWGKVTLGLLFRVIAILERNTGCGREAFTAAPSEIQVH